MSLGREPISAFGRMCLQVDHILMNATPHRRIWAIEGETHTIQFQTALKLFREKWGDMPIAMVVDGCDLAWGLRA